MTFLTDIAPRAQSLVSRLSDLLRGDAALMQRLAGATFAVRVVSAVIAFASQILLARWMGAYEYGIYVYVWTWVLLFGQAIDLGLSQTAQRFIPEYVERQLPDLLRGFLSGSRWFVVGMAGAIAATCAALIYALSPWLDDFVLIPLYLACLTLPAYALANTQDGIARSYDWIMLALTPTFLVRQFLMIGLAGGLLALRIPIDAVSMMVISGIAVWGTAIGQFVVLNRRLTTRVPRGPKTHDFRTWLATSLPIMVVEGFYLALAYTDVLVLQHFVPPDEVAVYYAAAKTLALVSFIYWSISATVAHRFSEYHVAGQRDRLEAFLAQSIRWTFWPSLAATAFLLLVGKPILNLFGDGFASGYHLMVLLSIGLLARSAIGPIEKLMNMLGEQKACAMVYAGAFLANLLLCLILAPRLGPAGAAIATSTAMVLETIALFVVTRRRLGFHVFVFRGR